MGQALYRKYRSRSFEEVVGQDPIITALKNSLRSKKISHAYLFTGPRGVGKTSVARILAHAISDIDYTKELAHIDIIEIDAASNRRIDEIRDLREKARVLPVTAKYKVYIIDEVHMLTREAFNALLKTLEEPPSHVVFILATTEAHKLPATIISRTQRYTFKPIAPAAMQKHLTSIAKQEKIDIEPEALHLIAEHADGSFRDAISLLDQVRGIGTSVTAVNIQTLLGIAPESTAKELLQALHSGDLAKISSVLQDTASNSYNPVSLSNQLSDNLRQQLLHETDRDQQIAILKLLRNLLGVASHPQPNRNLELVLMEAVLAQKPAAQQKTLVDNVKTVEVSKPPTPAAATNMQLDEQLWSSVLKAIKAKHTTLYGILRMGEASFDGNMLRLSFEFPFHQRRISEAKNRQILADIIREKSGKTVEIECVIVKPANKSSNESSQPTPQDNTLQTISNIFGSAEVIDS